MVTEDAASILKVSASSDPTRTASAISHAIYDGKEVYLRAIGAASVNQSVKAVAIARGFVASRGLSLAIVPGFTTVPMNDAPEVTAMLLRIVTT